MFASARMNPKTHGRRPTSRMRRLGPRLLAFAAVVLLPDCRLASALEPVAGRSQFGQVVVRRLPMGGPVSGYPRFEPQREVSRRGPHQAPMRMTREILRQRAALRFDELNMPSEAQLSGEDASLYRACAHLFVRELLRLRTGRECFREMLLHLSDNLN